MSTSFSIISKTTAFNTTFVDSNNNPISFLNPPTYSVYDFDNNFILGGTALQNTNQTSSWTANVALPENAPIPNESQKYSILWTGTPSNSNYPITNSELFTVFPLNPEYFEEEANQLVLQNTPFTLKLRVDIIPLNFSISIQDEKGMIYYEIPSTAVTFGHTLKQIGQYLYLIWSVPAVNSLSSGNQGVTNYIIIWTLQNEDGSYDNQIHNLYLINNYGMMFINNLRMTLDKIRNLDINPNLRWRDDELLHYSLVGLQKFNSYEPYQSWWTFQSLPQNLYYPILRCALDEAYNAWFLAETMTKFDFQGQSVQLNVDRVSEIQAAKNDNEQWLENHVRKIKKIMIRSSGAGSLAINIGAPTNFPGMSLNLAARAWASRLFSIGGWI